jgi:hypothetical protein
LKEKNKNVFDKEIIHPGQKNKKTKGKKTKQKGN